MDLKETIENALYSMGKFTTDECSEMAENIHFSIGQEAGHVDVIVNRATDIRDRNGRMILFGDTVRFVDKVEWYRGAYWAKVARGVMTREEALKEIEEKPYEERVVEDVQDYYWLLKSEIQTYWEVVDA